MTAKTLVRATERDSTDQSVPPFLQSTKLATMSKSGSDSKKSVAVEDDDEPDEW